MLRTLRAFFLFSQDPLFWPFLSIMVSIIMLLFHPFPPSFLLPPSLLCPPLSLPPPCPTLHFLLLEGPCLFFSSPRLPPARPLFYLSSLAGFSHLPSFRLLFLVDVARADAFRNSAWPGRGGSAWRKRSVTTNLGPSNTGLSLIPYHTLTPSPLSPLPLSLFPNPSPHPFSPFSSLSPLFSSPLRAAQIMAEPPA